MDKHDVVEQSASKERAVLHIDMNAFYCSCHSAAEPGKYENRPTAVAGSPETRHGVVVTASYEARKLGVRATMTVAEALRVAPDLTLIHPDFSLYRAFSRKVFEIVRSVTPIVEVFSIDECFADVTDSWRMGNPVELAKLLHERIATELHLPCSIGVSNNKFLAKMASDFQKPNGITVINTANVSQMLWSLPVREMFGIGEKSAERLNRLCIRTIGELAQADERLLRRHFGVRGPQLKQLASGVDQSPVQEVSEPAKSIGHSITLARDLRGFDELCTVLLNLADQVGRRIRRHQMNGRAVQITIRYATRKTVTRQATLAAATDLTEVIYQTSVQLLRENWKPGTLVRLLGVTVNQLTHLSELDSKTQPAAVTKGVQLTLFDELRLTPQQEGKTRPLPHDDQATNNSTGLLRNLQSSQSTKPSPNVNQLKKLTEVTDALRDKYGEDIVVRGRMLQDPESGQIRNRKVRGTSLQKDEL